MIDHINSYRLNTKVSDYAEGDLSEFTVVDYRVAEDEGRSPVFENEVFYRAESNEFLGRDWQAMVSAIDGVICKVSFCRIEPEDEDLVQLRRELASYLIEHMGEFSEKREVADASLFIWDSEQGNVVLQCDPIYTEVILTSCALKMAKPKGLKRSFLGRLFGGN